MNLTKQIIDHSENAIEYLKSNQIKTLRISVANGVIKIKNLPFNSNIILHLAGISLGIIISFEENVFIVGILFALVNLIFLSSDLAPVNSIEVNCIEKSFTKKHLFFWSKIKVDFKEIKEFSIEKSPQGGVYKRFRINCETILEEKILLFDTSYQKDAEFLISYLKKLTNC